MYRINSFFLIYFLLFTTIIFAQNSSIKMISTEGTSILGTTGQIFMIEVEVGNPNIVTDLVGVSFNLTWDREDLIEGSNTTASAFFGENPLVIGQNFDGRMEVGVTSSTGGKSGSGIIALCELKVKTDIPNNTSITFNLENIQAIDGNGNEITLDPENNSYDIVFNESGGTNGSIRMRISESFINGNENSTFTIEVEVGNPTAVTDLVGVSFNLTWDRGDLIEGSNTTIGTFFGSNPLVIGQNFDGRIEVGVTSTTGGKSGGGIIATCELRVRTDIPSNTSITFNFENIQAIDGNGNEIILNPENNSYGVVVDVNEISKIYSFVLNQNYPNPFNPTTRIKYDLPKASNVQLIVYDNLGREVATLVNEQKPAGSYEVEFDASQLSNGVYFYELRAGDFRDVKKLVLLK